MTIRSERTAVFLGGCLLDVMMLPSVKTSKLCKCYSLYTACFSLSLGQTLSPTREKHLGKLLNTHRGISVKLFWLQNEGRMSWNGKVSGRESSKEAAAVTEREYQM